MSQGNNGDGPPRPSTIVHSEGTEANERAFAPQLVSLTPTSSVAVLGLAGMRYGQPLREQPLGVQPPGSMQPAREFLTAQPSAISLSHEQRNELLANALSGLPIGRYLSSLEMYRREAQVPYRVPNMLAGSDPAALAVAFANANVPAALVAPGNELARSQTTMGLPIATTSTTPALFVNTSHINSHARSAPNPGALPMDINTQQQQQQQQQLPTNTHTTSPLRSVIIPAQEGKASPAGEKPRGRGRGRGRPRGGPGRPLDHNASLNSTAASSPSNCISRSPRLSGHTARPAETDSEVVIRMDDLVERGAVVRIQDSPAVYQVPQELLSAGRSSITIGAPVGSDKRRFNLKWLYDYPWLRFDPLTNSMLCSLCRQGKRANQFAKRGSRNFKTSALVDHSSSNDHQRSVAQFGAPARSDNPGMVLLDGTWLAVECASLGKGALWVAQGQVPATASNCDAKDPGAPASSVGGSATGIVPSASAAEQTSNRQRAPQPAIVSSPPLLSTANIDGSDMQMSAPQPKAIGSCSTGDTITTIASRPSTIEEQGGENALQKKEQNSQASYKPEHSMMEVNRSCGPVQRKRSRDTVGSSSSSQPDEKYAREFEYAVQALLQAMQLNLPISAVADLYRLKMEPTPLSDIGSVGYVDRIKSAAAGADNSSSSRSATDLRLAGALANTTEAARALQHVVSSEILSLIKDEVSQSPAFSVIIDEAPLREHNSLVAHVLLYLRYMRRDPESPHGELQVITRFWRCVHLYHESSDGRLARRDPTGLVLGLLERAKIDTSRLVCISSERPASREDEAAERQKRPHVIHWRGIFTHPNSLSAQVYEEITQQSDDFVEFSMTLMDLCLFMYSYPSQFAFLGVDFQETLYKTLYEIFLGEGSLSTRLPISLTPAIVIAITRSISQIMATVLALSKVPSRGGFMTTTANHAGAGVPDSGDIQGMHTSSPKSPRSSLQIPLPVVDILVSSFGGLGSKKSVGRCPPADVLFERLRDYSFLGCLHFMSDILMQIKPIIDISGCNDMPVRAFGELVEPANHMLDQRLRAYVGTVRDAIESVTLMYGEEDDHSHDYHSFGHGNGGNETGEEEYSGFHLNEFMHLTDTEDAECSFRTFRVANYVPEHSQTRLVDLIRTVSSAILHDLNQRFNASDITTIQALADMWDPTQFPRQPSESASFGNSQMQALVSQFSRSHLFGRSGLNLLGVPIAPQSAGGKRPSLPKVAQSTSNTPLLDADAVEGEWQEFKEKTHLTVSRIMRGSPAKGNYPPGKIQLAYRQQLFPEGRLAPSRRRLRSVSYGAGHETSAQGDFMQSAVGSKGLEKEGGWATEYKNLSKLATAWNVLPLALSIDLHLFRRLYERQLSRICREQAEHKLQSINFDMGDTFSELLNRLSPPHSKSKKVTVYDLLQNSKFEVQNEIGSFERPVEIELSGVTAEYFLRSIDAVTMALDHRLRLLSIGYTESPLAVPRSPGECPKWLQNAMRGYWKLACRPSKSSLGKQPASGAAGGYAGSGSSSTRVSRKCTTGNNTPMPTKSAGGSQQQQQAHDFGMQNAVASGSKREMDVVETAPSTARTLPHRRDASIGSGGLEAMQLHPLSSGTHPSISIQSSALFTSSVQQPASVGEDVGTLPLLEALLSDPANAPPDSAPASLTTYPQMADKRPQQQASMSQQPGMSQQTGAAKRGYGQLTDRFGGSDPSAYAIPSGSDPKAANKRMRPSDEAARLSGAFDYNYGYPGNGFKQEMAGPASERYGLDPAFARLASDMGLNSVSTQALAATLSNQSSQIMPSRGSLDNPNASMGLQMAADMPQQPSASSMVPPGAMNPMFAGAPGNPAHPSQYMAFDSRVSSRQSLLGMNTSLGPANSQALGQMMDVQQMQFSAPDKTVPQPVPSNAFDYQLHFCLPDK
ncbi:hypothetical protein LPJ68_003057 [Coemansia sp. RSA 1086]|nr:hypothetical protein LPJ68_003057 [Coemansia sp. RSA 1086]